MSVRVCLLAAGEQSRSGQICAKAMTKIDGVPVLAYLVDAIPAHYPVDLVTLKDNPSIIEMKRIIDGRGKVLLLDESKSQGDTMRQYAGVMPCQEIVFISADTYPGIPLQLKIPGFSPCLFYDPWENVSIFRSYTIGVLNISDAIDKLEYAMVFDCPVKLDHFNCINVNDWESVHRILRDFHTGTVKLVDSELSQEDLG